MPAAARQGDLVITGHICSGSTTLAIPTQFTVRINGKLACRKGDLTVVHTFPAGNQCVPHVASINAGSSTVRIAGKAAARVSDSADVGFISAGSPNVSIG